MDYEVTSLAQCGAEEIKAIVDGLCDVAYQMAVPVPIATQLTPDAPVADTAVIRLPRPLTGRYVAVTVAKVLFPQHRTLIHLMATEAGAMLVEYVLDRPGDSGAIPVLRATARMFTVQIAGEYTASPFLRHLLKYAGGSVGDALKRMLQPGGGQLYVPTFTVCV